MDLPDLFPVADETRKFGIVEKAQNFSLLGRGQEPVLPVCSGSGELHTPLSGFGKVNGEGASRWHS